MQVKIPDFNLPVVTVFTDASNLGWGAQIIWPDKSKVNINGVWSENEVEDHINIKELRTVLLALKSCSKKLNKVVIKIFSDNRSTVLWIKKESSSRSIKAREIIYELLKMKYKNEFILRPIYMLKVRKMLSRMACLDPYNSMRSWRLHKFALISYAD